jgi:hypothetical protein
MNLFNIGKKEEVKEVKPSPITMVINNIKHVIEDSLFIKVQSSADDVSVYGWSLETRYQMRQGEWTSWYTYYNHRIYNTKESAIDASIKAGLTNRQDRECRVIPLYRMTEPQYREYKIDKLLGNDKKREVYEIKGWKLKEDYDWYKAPNNGTIVHKKGTIYIQLENGDVIKSGTADEYTWRIGRSRLLTELIPKNLVEEIDITDEKWLHPHLLKELKIKLKIK